MMAVIHTTQVRPYPASASGEALLQELIAELRRPPTPDQPLKQPIVLEQELPTKTLHVAVVWEKWQLVASADRSKIILQAYEDALPDRVDKITIALAATTDEAISLGLLPFGVEPVVAPGAVDPAIIRQLMIDEGAVPTASGWKLRFPDRSSADAALRRLGVKSQPHYWTLVQTINPS